MALEFRRLPPTVEDRLILDRLPIRTEARYRFSDEGDAMRTRAALASFGRVTECVTLIEKAQRSIERRLERSLIVSRDVWELWVRSYGEAGARRLCASSGLLPRSSERGRQA
jgi:hypothetical protein